MGNRITPADAGKTLQTNVKQFPCKDHPRGCGENIHAESVPCNVGGSPPRMRGKRVCRRNRHIKSGITPADAGKTADEIADDIIRRDHPRGCGENCVRKTA